MKNNQKLTAFSMIELSMSLVIVGLLIGGIVGGKKLISLSNTMKARALTNSAPMTAMKGLVLWVETTSKNSFDAANPADGSAISNWKDINPQSTIKNNFIQPTGANQPTYYLNGISGLPILRFNGTSSFMYISSLSSAALGISDQASIFMVFKPNTINQAVRVVFSYQTASTNRISFQFNSSNLIPRFDFPNDSGGLLGGSTAVSSGGKLILSLIKSSTTQSIYTNGTANGSKSNSLSLSPLTSTFYIGTYDGTLFDTDMDLGEIIIFNRALTTSERQEVQTYLSKKWGIKLTN